MPDPNSTSDSPPRQAFYDAPPLQATPSYLAQLDICSRATTLVAYHPDLKRNVIVSVTCKTWSCPPCSRSKIRRLATLTALACPNKLLTLTVNPALYSSPREAFDATAVRVPELIRSLRVKHAPIEYLRVTEQTHKGFPHYHLMVRSAYLPQGLIKKVWSRLTQATIVDIRQTTNHFGAYQYLVKYLTKLHRLDWTERQVSYSRAFFPPGATDDAERAKLVMQDRVDEHPWVYVANHYANCYLTWVTPNSWVMPDHPNENTCPVTAKDCGVLPLVIDLPPRQPYTPPPSLLP